MCTVTLIEKGGCYIVLVPCSILPVPVLIPAFSKLVRTQNVMYVTMVMFWMVTRQQVFPVWPYKRECVQTLVRLLTGQVWGTQRYTWLYIDEKYPINQDHIIWIETLSWIQAFFHGGESGYVSERFRVLHDEFFTWKKGLLLRSHWTVPHELSFRAAPCVTRWICYMGGRFAITF